ncbi:MAG: putative membrane protein [Bradymonadia bacterium]|jgi:uncharacterized membrane protein
MKHWGPRGGALVLAALMVPATIVRLRGLDRPSIRTVAFVPLVAMAMLLGGAVLNRVGFVLAVPSAVNAVLLAGFAPTLWRGPPMVERFARIQHKDLTDAEVRWCRSWTVVWCAFFAWNGTVAAALAVFAPLEWWTGYNGFLSYMQMGILFIVEFVFRKIRFRRFDDRFPDRWLRKLVEKGAA